MTLAEELEVVMDYNVRSARLWARVDEHGNVKLLESAAVIHVGPAGAMYHGDATVHIVEYLDVVYAVSKRRWMLHAGDEILRHDILGEFEDVDQAITAVVLGRLYDVA